MRPLSLLMCLWLALCGQAVHFSDLSHQAGRQSSQRPQSLERKIEASFDHGPWSQLLQANVQILRGGQASLVDYRSMQADEATLDQYLDALGGVGQDRFDQWPEAEQLAFLINAYNAWTVKLILSEYPDLVSIRDLGGFLRSPWKRSFIPLLGQELSLDDIEHGLIRDARRYREPRIHFAVNCASIGCPALRAEAYTGPQLAQQLQEQTAAFLADRSRNRVAGEQLQLSKIFKWYRGDFTRGWQGYERLEDFLLDYAEALGLSAEQRLLLASGAMGIEFLDYDWNLNDVQSHQGSVSKR